jgi:hypothetical protein
MAAHPLWQPTEFQLILRDFAAIRRAVQQNPADAESVQSLAENVLARTDSIPELAGEAQFLLANVYLRLAEKQGEPRPEAYRRRALHHLNQAASLGVPEGDQQRFFFLLGKLTVQTGGVRKRAIELLTLGLPSGATDPSEGYALLVRAHLAEPHPDLDAALRANLEQLKYGGDEDTLAPVRLLRAELLLKSRQRSEAYRWLTRLGTSTNPDVRKQARSILAAALEEDFRWAQAAAAWQEVLTDAAPAERPRALYHLGLCHLNLEPVDLPTAMAAWQEIGPDCGDEAQAAALLLAELHLRRGEIDPALADLERALDRVKTAAEYHNPLVPLARLREMFELGQRKCTEAKQYDRGGPLMHLYRQIAEPGVAEERLGALFELWAHELQGQPMPAIPADAIEYHKQIRSLFSQAGAAFKEVADVNPQATEPLWRSGNCFFYAQAFKEAAEVLARFLNSGKAGEHESEAWFALAEAYKAMNHTALSREAYLKCLEFEGSSFAARANYQLAVLAIANSHLDEAEEILTQQVNNATGTTVEREARRKALFTLGELLYKSLQYEKAEYRLAIALNEFPNHPETLLLKDQLGDSRRHIAWQLYEQVKNAAPSLRDKLRKERREKLEDAGRVYDSLSVELRNRESSLAGTERNLLRKARYAAADCLFEREQYVSALYRYAECAQSYAGTREGLLAYEKMISCYGNQRVSDGERSDAAATTAAAIRITVQRFQDIPESSFPFPSEMYTKQYWQTRLERHSSLFRLDSPPWRLR